jgi:hypothetical protein
MPEQAGQASPQLDASQAARARADYAEIEALLLGSLPGRRFLSEHARRSRAADGERLLKALTRLEMGAARPARRQDQVSGGLIEMREAIERMRAELAAVGPPHQPSAPQGLEAIVEATQQATSEIMEGAEAISDAAWSLRERGAVPALCDAVERRVTGILRACAVQAVSARRLKTVVAVLTLIERRLKARIASAGVEDPSTCGDGARGNGQDRTEPPLPVAAPSGLPTLSTAAETLPVAAETSRAKSSAFGTLDAVKRAALFG